MIAVSIVTYMTDLSELETCLQCVFSCSDITRVDIIDNSSQEYIREFIENKFPQANYLPSENIGYGAANNISIRRSIDDAEIRYHLVINSDIEFDSEVIETLKEKLEKDQSIGLIMPAVTGIDNAPQSSCHPLPTPFDLLLHRFTSNMFFKWRKGYDLYAQDFKGDTNVPYMHGCFMLFRVDALRKAGLFDERFFMYPEDIDITRRVHRYYKTIVTPDATIAHYHRAASRHNFKMLRIHAWNMLKYFAKWGFFFDKERRQFNRALRKQLSK